MLNLILFELIFRIVFLQKLFIFVIDKFSAIAEVNLKIIHYKAKIDQILWSLVMIVKIYFKWH